MYFIQQLKQQITHSIFLNNNSIETGAGVERSEQIRRPSEGALTPEGVRELAEDAGRTTQRMEVRREELRIGAESLTGGDGIDTLVGEEGDDTLGDSPEIVNGEGVEHPDSAGTARIEDVEDVAERNGMGAVGEEEPQVGEDGNEMQNPEPTPEETARRTQSLTADRARTQQNIENTQPGTPERQAAEQQMSAIQMLLNILEYGSINPPSGAVDGQGNPVEGQNSYGGGIGERYTGGISELSPEQAVVGHELATWLQQRGYPVFEGQPNYCGKNVGEAMNAFGYQGLPSSGRNGADWARICAERPSQFQQINCRPENAPAGALISYERNSGGSAARQASGHIEIALGEGRGYYFGAVASQPGGSQKPPREGSYTIWMPTSKTA